MVAQSPAGLGVQLSLCLFLLSGHGIEELSPGPGEQGEIFMQDHLVKGDAASIPGGSL